MMLGLWVLLQVKLGCMSIVVGKGFGWVQFIVVSSSCQREGIESKLVSAVCDHYRKIGVKEIRIRISLENVPSRNLFKRLRFKEFKITYANNCKSS